MYLNNHSYYSLRYGTISEEELLVLAQKAGCTTLALTDINNTSGCLNFVRKSTEYDIKPILGIDFRNGVQCCYVTLARNNNGFLQLNNFLSKYLHAKTPFPDHAPHFEDAICIYPFERVLELDKTEFLDQEYIGVRIKDLQKLRFSRLSEYKDKLLILHPVSFRDKRDFNTHRLLRAIDTNTLLSKLPESEQGSPDEKMGTAAALQKAYSDFPNIIKNTQRILDSCSIFFDFSKDKPPQNLKTVEGSATKDYKKLLALCNKGLPQRYEKITSQIRQRLAKELKLIQQQKYVAFFLINWRIVDYARSMGYFHVGRGSGANSIVAYLLGITDVDPIELDLYFERFMNL